MSGAGPPPVDGGDRRAGDDTRTPPTRIEIRPAWIRGGVWCGQSGDCDLRRETRLPSPTDVRSTRLKDIVDFRRGTGVQRCCLGARQ